MPRAVPDKKHLGFVARDQLASHGQRRNDVATGAAAGNENAQVRQALASQRDTGETESNLGAVAERST